MTINLARSTCRASGPNNRGNNGETRPNSSPGLVSPRLPSPALGVRDQASAPFLPSFLFPSGLPFSHLGGQCLHSPVLRGERERERERRRQKPICIRGFASDGCRSGREGGREREGRRSEGDRGEARRGGEARRRGRERPKSERGMHELKQRDRGSSCSALLAALRGVQVHAAARFEPLP